MSGSGGPGPKKGDDFVAATLILFDSANHRKVDEKTRIAAEAYLNRIKSSPDGWKFCLQKLHQISRAGGQNEVKFWCLQQITTVIANRWLELSEEDRKQLKAGLLVYLRDVISKMPQPPFIKTKLSVAFVTILKYDYPVRWPTFFKEFLSLLNQGAEVVDVFFRVLKAIDQDVVVFDPNRSEEERKRNQAIKDAMREDCVNHIVQAVHGIVIACHASHQKLAKEALTVLASYISWIDISLVTNERFVTLLYKFFTIEPLQNAACDCVNEILYKGMDLPKKFALIRSIRVLDMLQHLKVSSSQDFALKVSSLVNTLGMQILDCDRFARSGGMDMKRGRMDSVDPSDGIIDLVSPVTPTPPPPPAKSLSKSSSGSSPSGGEGSIPEDETRKALEQIVQISHRFFEHPNYLVRNECVEFFVAYIKRMKKYPPAMGSPEWENIDRLLNDIYSGIQFPQGYNFETQEDKEIEFNTFRSALLKIFTNLADLNSDLVIKRVAQRISETIGQVGSRTPTQIEASLQLLWFLGQSVPMEKLNSEPFKLMLGALFSSKVSQHPHPQVAICYFECVLRYARFLEAHRQLLPTIVTSFMDRRGIQHSHAAVRSRCCYLLLRLIKGFSDGAKKQFRPLVDDILKGITAIIEPIFNRGLSGSSACILTQEDALNLCEVMGVLVSSTITGEKFPEYCAAVMSLLTKPLDMSADKQQQLLRADSGIIGKHFSQVVDAIGCFSKNLSLARDTPKVRALFGQVLERVLQVHAVVPSHADIRAKTIMFLHQMIKCLQDEVIKYLPLALVPMLKHTDSANVVPLLQLLNQLSRTFETKLFATLDAHFIPIIAKIFDCIQSYAYIDKAGATEAAYSTEKKDRVALQKLYFTFIKDLVHSNLTPILMSERNKPHLKGVLDTLLQGCVRPPEPTIHKVAFQTLQRLSSFLHSMRKGQDLDPLFQKFIFYDITEKVFQCVLASDFDFKDPECYAIIRTIVALQKEAQTNFKEPYLRAVGEYLMKSLACPSELAQRYVMSLAKGSESQFRDFFQAFITQKRAQLLPKR